MKLGNMKLVIIAASLALGILSLSAAKKIETEVTSFTNPDNDALKAVISDLYKAINTKNDSNRDQYIEDARKSLRAVEKKTIYPAQLICDGKSLWTIKENFDHCEGWLDFCFRGEQNAALSLVRIAMSQQLLGSDEEWFEDARIEDGQLYVTFVDGPNEYSEDQVVSLCK